jgi:hypothetical protein
MNENFFSRNKSEEIGPMGVRTTVERPEQPINRLGDDELNIMKSDFGKSNSDRNTKVDPYFMQEITDRILGPDSEAYTNELIELNMKYSPRVSKTGPSLYKEMKHVLSFSELNEGKTAKAAKKPFEKEVWDADKKETFRTTIKDFLRGKDCKVKQVGDDFEVHVDKEHVAQVMFRKDLVTVKKEGSKFGKDFKYTQLGEIKKELTSVIKSK